jgi:hypothetical protein
VIRLYIIGKSVRGRGRTIVLTVMRLYREESEGEGEDWGVTLMKLYILGKRVGEGEDCGLTVMRLYIIGRRARARERTGG